MSHISAISISLEIHGRRPGNPALQRFLLDILVLLMSLPSLLQATSPIRSEKGFGWPFLGGQLPQIRIPN